MEVIKYVKKISQEMFNKNKNLEARVKKIIII